MKGLNYCDGKTVRKSLNFVECVAKTKLNFTAMVTFSPNLKKSLYYYIKPKEMLAYYKFGI